MLTMPYYAAVRGEGFAFADMRKGRVASAVRAAERRSQRGLHASSRTGLMHSLKRPIHRIGDAGENLREFVFCGSHCESLPDE